MEYLVRIPSGITIPTESEGLQDSTAAQLFHHVIGLKEIGNQLLVGFEKTHVVGPGEVYASADKIALRRELGTHGESEHFGVLETVGIGRGRGSGRLVL